MANVLRMRTWAGPVTIGAFFVLSGTGILMFFHWNVGLAKLAHEWLGWLLIVGGLAHLCVNWKAFVAYLRQPLGAGIIVVLCLLGILSLFAAGRGGHGRPPFMEMSRAMERSPLQLVAQVAQRSPESAIDDLKVRGILVRDPQQTIAEIATENETGTTAVLACVFGGEAESPGRQGGH